MAVLSEQLEQLRTEKHKAEVEHVRKEHERDMEVEGLSKDKLELNQEILVCYSEKCRWNLAKELCFRKTLHSVCPTCGTTLRSVEF